MIPAMVAHDQRRNHEHPVAQRASGVFQDLDRFNLDLRPSCPQLIQQSLSKQAARSDSRFVVNDPHGRRLLLGAHPYF